MGCGASGASAVPPLPRSDARVAAHALPSLLSSNEQAKDTFKYKVRTEHSDGSIKFDFISGALSTDELRGIQHYADKRLGKDKTSEYFMRRRKAIAFVFVLHGQVYSLEQNYFVQHQSYNDFSGGYRREYPKIEDAILQNELRSVILRFVEYNNIADRTIMLVQVQMSEVDAGEADGDELKRLKSVTGQGIHTDGHEKAMLACIRRTNVSGAMNQYFADLDGNQPLCEPRILQEGDVTFFKDNELYHYVSPAGPAQADNDMARTMLLIHYPAEELLVGAANAKNTGGTRLAEVRLRDQETAPRDHEV